jgi:hypothetical protein
MKQRNMRVRGRGEEREQCYQASVLELCRNCAVRARDAKKLEVARERERERERSKFPTDKLICKSEMCKRWRLDVCRRAGRGECERFRYYGAKVQIKQSQEQFESRVSGSLQLLHSPTRSGVERERVEGAKWT